MFIFPFTSCTLIIRYYRTVNGILEGDDPEAKQKGLMGKVKEMRDGLANRIPNNTRTPLAASSDAADASRLKSGEISLCTVTKRYVQILFARCPFSC
jgi:hypothetical protein